MNSPDGQSILVIDSGVGGLSICQSILALEPSLQLIYFADDAYFPYGLMAEQKLSKRLHEIISVMLPRHQPDLVVLACNTISTFVLPELRAEFNIPFVGVVPAIKPAVKLSKTKKIGLLATPATIKRAYTDNLILDYAQGCNVIRIGSCELVLEAENFLSGKEVSDEIILMALEAFKDGQQQVIVDTVVLGCTHFPLLKARLSELLPEVTWVDSGKAIARRVMSILNEITDHEIGSDGLREDDCKGGGCTEIGKEEPAHQFYFSGVKPDAKVFKQALTRLNIGQHKLHCF